MPRLRHLLALAAVVVVAVVVPVLPVLLQPGLPPLQDATGLSGEGLVAAEAAGEPEVVRLTAAGASRAYLLARARRVERREDPSLLVVLPAANRTVRQTYEQLGLDPLRDHGITVVVASALDGWNAGSCCGRAVARDIDDVRALRTMTAHAVERSGADPDRIAVLGYSTGGFMVYRLLCEGALGVRAAVEVAGSLAVACDRPVDVPPLLALHGTEDRTVPLGPTGTRVPVLGTVPLGVRLAVERLSQSAGCRPGTCPVRLVEVPGAGHSWEDLAPGPRIAAFLAEHLPGVR